MGNGKIMIFKIFNRFVNHRPGLEGLRYYSFSDIDDESLASRNTIERRR